MTPPKNAQIQPQFVYIEIDSIEIAKDDNEDLWRFSFSNLLKYDENGNEYVYTISQDNVPLYSSNFNDFNIVNRFSNKENEQQNTDKNTSNHTLPNTPNTSDNMPLYCTLGLITSTFMVLGLIFLQKRH